MKRVLMGLGLFVLLAAINVATVVIVLQGAGLSRAGSDTTCYSADMNGDGFFTIVDPIRMLNFLFNSGPPPEACAGGGSEPQFTDAEVELLRDVIPHISIEYLDNGATGEVKTIRFSAVNLQVVNGLDATNGNEVDPDTVDPDDTNVNGTGNIIVGYNELGGVNPNSPFRTGSHNVVIGSHNAYTSFGALIVGRASTSEAPYANVLGGEFNHSFGDYASVTGGRNNIASGAYSSVAGGGSLAAPEGNVASGIFSSILGGSENNAEGLRAVCVGGTGNTASGAASVAVCGTDTEAAGDQAVVLGGANNVAAGSYSVVCGGQTNEASGLYSVIGGGSEGAIDGAWDWLAGELFEEE